MYQTYFIEAPILNETERSWARFKANSNVNKFTDS